MGDDGLVISVAAEHVHWHGLQAVEYLRDCETIALERGDVLSAEAWGDIAEAAAAILQRLNDRSTGRNGRAFRG